MRGRIWLAPFYLGGYTYRLGDHNLIRARDTLVSRFREFPLSCQFLSTYTRNAGVVTVDCTGFYVVFQRWKNDVGVRLGNAGAEKFPCHRKHMVVPTIRDKATAFSSIQVKCINNHLVCLLQGSGATKIQ